MTDIDILVAGLEDVPIIKPYRGRYLYDFVIEHEFENCLELGFAMGASASYVAGALDELGRGRLTAVDRVDAPFEHPTIEGVLASLDLTGWVEVVREPRSYTWFLMRQLEIADHPRYDFVFIDGGHTWDLDGFAFLLVDRLLRPGGWILFDDLDWSFERSPTQRDKVEVRALPEEEQVTLQLRKVWDLLVKPHPRYARHFDWSGWGFAQKLGDDHLAAPDRAKHIATSGAREVARFGSRARRKLQTLADQRNPSGGPE